MLHRLEQARHAKNRPQLDEDQANTKKRKHKNVIAAQTSPKAKAKTKPSARTSQPSAKNGSAPGPAAARPGAPMQKGSAGAASGRGGGGGGSKGASPQQPAAPRGQFHHSHLRDVPLRQTPWRRQREKWLRWDGAAREDQAARNAWMGGGRNLASSYG